MARDRSWKVTIPFMLVPFEDAYWTDYRELAAAMKADRVLLVGPGQRAGDTPPVDHFRELSESLMQKIAFFAEEGIEVGFWAWRTIGHTKSFASGGSSMGFQPLVGPTGADAGVCFCPLDARFRAYIAECLAAVAESGVGLILLDDDFRMNWHGAEARTSCFCPLHLAEIGRRIGRTVTRDEVVREALSGEPSAMRREWLAVNAMGLDLLAGDIEKAVHKVNPSTRIGAAITYNLFDNEGLDMPALVKRLAGPTRPILRTSGAPYWSQEPSNASWVTELTRQQAWWMEGADCELLAEGDTAPHTRFHCSAEALDAYQEFLMASGFPGVLSYPVVYAPRPNHELAYVRKTVESLPRYEAVRRFFPADYADVGVMPLEMPNSIINRTLPSSPSDSLPTNPLTSVRWLSRMGVPLAWGESGPVVIAGVSAKSLSDDDLNRALGRGAIVDGVAAEWLVKRGFDLGIASIKPAAEMPVFERFLETEFSGEHGGEHIRLFTGDAVTYFDCWLKPGAKLLSEFVSIGSGIVYSGAFLYENARAQRVCVLPVGLDGALAGHIQLLLDYARQEQLTRTLAWVAHEPLAATAYGHADAHVLCRRSPDGGRIVVGVQNAHLDTIGEVALRLHPAARVSARLEVLLPDAVNVKRTSQFAYFNDGQFGYLTVKYPVPPMGFMGIALHWK
jgi:hypothetical protein